MRSPFHNETELEDFLSVPTPADIAAASMLASPLLILGAGGKMGPTLSMRAKRANPGLRVIAVSRFSDHAARQRLEAYGVETCSLDLLNGDLTGLPDSEQLIYLAGRKFGSSGQPSLTWAMNAIVPARVAARYCRAKIVALSSGNIYPLSTPESGGPGEDSPAGPVGEYAQSVLARERVFEHYALSAGTETLLVRLNYAVEPRYGVLVDVATKVLRGEAVPLSMGYANVIWQGDANSIILRAFSLCASPAAVLNLTGPEILSIRNVAEGFARRFGMTARWDGAEQETALLNNASRCMELFGPPSVSVEQAMDWTAEWLQAGARVLGKPTHFEARSGNF